MASLFGLLSIGANSLAVQQAGIGNTGNNIANAQTPGYARRDLLINEGRGPFAGGGATVRGVNRAEDFVLSQKIVHQHGELLNRNMLASGLREIEGLVRTGQQSLSQEVAELGSAFSQLAADPKDPVRRQEVIARGQVVTTEFNRIADALGRLQAADRQSTAALLPQINDLAGQIADINGRVLVGAGGSMAADPAQQSRLLDQRDEAVRALAGLTGGEALQNSDGTVDVLVGGLSLVHGSFVQALDVTEQGGATVVTVGGAQIHQPVGGELGGHLLVQDSARATLSQFDRLAFDLSSAINAQHAFGVGLDGAGGRPFFARLGAVPGAARDLKIDPALSPETLAAGFTAAPGDNRNALALSNLIDQPVLEGGKSTFRNVYARITAQLGQDVQGADAEAKIADSGEQSLAQARDALAGVSTDEEMTRLTAYQRGFEASAKFIKVIDEMLAQLVQL